VTRRLLYPLNPLYAAAIAAKYAAYDHGWLKTRRLQWPVISVGNISVGGSGKTPFVICLTKLLMQHGLRVDILSRGYGRNSDRVERVYPGVDPGVDPGGDVERFGDEPLLIAQSTGAPVYVGASRYVAGLLAEKNETGPRIHLLDDGFQHRKLVRDLDVVLVHRSDFSETLLPAGNLREPLSSLKRASAVVLREEDAELEQQLRQRGIDAPVWLIRRTVNVPSDAGKTIAFCGIARPEDFFSSVRASNAEVAAGCAFLDHHRYSDEDLRQLIQRARSVKADSFVTTEKDVVRLSRSQKEQLGAIAPLKLVKLEVRLLDESSVLQLISNLKAQDTLNRPNKAINGNEK
jgi:tetraacyldisaccharide 4'-kinase